MRYCYFILYCLVIDHNFVLYEITLKHCYWQSKNRSKFVVSKWTKSGCFCWSFIQRYFITVSWLTPCPNKDVRRLKYFYIKCGFDRFFKRLVHDSKLARWVCDFQEAFSQGYIFFKWPVFYSPDGRTLWQKFLLLKTTQPSLINVYVYVSHFTYFFKILTSKWPKNAIKYVN